MVAFWDKLFKKKKEDKKEKKVIKKKEEKKEEIEKKKVLSTKKRTAKPAKEKVTKKKVEEKPEKKAVAPTKSKAPKEEIKVLKPKAGSKFAGKILIRPLITEKSALLGSEGKYTFEIAPRANKAEVAKAIYDLYGEKSKSVNIIRVRGKMVQYGRTQGKRKDWKKAIITLKPGVKLELFEGV